MNDTGQTILAIMQFLHNFDGEVCVDRLVSGMSYGKLLSQIPQMQFDQMELKYNTQSWVSKVSNLSMILYEMQEYLEVLFGKTICTNDIDLVELCKQNQLEEMKKFFEVFMGFLMQTPYKEHYIQQIMNLEHNNQQQFVDLIKNALERVSTKKIKSENKLNRAIFQLEDQKVEMEKQVERLCKANFQLLEKNKENQITIEELTQKANRNTEQVSNFGNQAQQYFQTYIQSLKQRIYQVEKEKQNLVLDSQEMLIKLEKYDQLQQMCRFYKENYDDMKEQFNKMNMWKKDKVKMEKIIEDKQFMIQKLQDRVDQLVEKNISLQELQIELKLQGEKNNLRMKKIKSEIRRTISIDTEPTATLHNVLDQSFKQNLTFLEEEQSKCELKKNYEKVLKENKLLSKELKKAQKKVEIVKLLEQDKKKLQNLVAELRSMYQEEMNLVLSTMYETYIDSFEKFKKWKL